MNVGMAATNRTNVLNVNMHLSPSTNSKFTRSIVTLLVLQNLTNVRIATIRDLQLLISRATIFESTLPRFRLYVTSSTVNSPAHRNGILKGTNADMVRKPTSATNANMLPIPLRVSSVIYNRNTAINPKGNEEAIKKPLYTTLKKRDKKKSLSSNKNQLSLPCGPPLQQSNNWSGY